MRFFKTGCFLSFILIIFNCITLSAQTDQSNTPNNKEIILTGVVLDEMGLPIPGASIVLARYRIGTTSDLDGKFSLKIPQKEGLTLEISFMGMEKFIYPIKKFDHKPIRISMKENTTQIKEVVVTGMFERKKEGYTGSVVTISGEDVKKISTTDISKAISSIEPGFRVMENISSGSNPNRLPDMRMRGSSTLPSGQTTDVDAVSLQGEYSTYPNQPLLIMDGFEIDVQTMADLDPDRVESITILKDASATAIYGSKASNGVIVIQTIAPKAGAMRVTYGGNLRFQTTDLSSYNLMNSEEKIYAEKLAGLYAENDFDAQQDYQNRLRAVKRGVDTYWLSKPLRSAWQQRHAVTLDGGTNELRYKMYVGLNATPGVMMGSSRNTQTASLDLSYIFKKIIMKNSITVNNATSSNSPYGSYSQYSKLNPYLEPYDENGNVNKIMQTWNMLYNGSTEGYAVTNPIYNTTFNSKDGGSNFSVRDLFILEYRPIDGMLLQGNISVNKTTSKDEVFRPGYHTEFAHVTDPTLKGDFKRVQGESLSYQVDLSASYNKSLNNQHFFTSNLRYSVYEDSSESFGAKVTGFPNDQMDHILFGKKYKENMTGSENTTRSVGGILALGYSYEYKYSVDFNLRVDGSSQFGKDNRFAPFWSTGAKWNLKKEKFIKDVHWIDDLVLAYSYGITGTQGFAPYQSRQVYSYSNLMRYYMSSDATGIELVALGNDKLKWQQTGTSNIRLELSLLKGRISSRVEYYQKMTKNSLAQITLAPSLGFNTYPENLGQVENKGVEFNFSLIPYRDNKKGAYWVITLNGAHNKNKLTKISEALQYQNKINAANALTTDVPLPQYVEGQSTTRIWVVRSNGIDPATGDEILVKRDGSITSTYSSSDLVPYGDTEPKWQGNINSSFVYKGWGASLACNYKFGGQTYNETLVEKVENSDLRYNVDKRVLTLRWKNPGDIAKYKRLTNSVSGSNTQATSRFVMDENIFNISSVSFFYRMDKTNTKFLDKWFISSMKWSLNFEDLLYLSTIKRERGLDYPYARQFSLSLNLVF